jgi:hypothetical protein
MRVTFRLVRVGELFNCNGNTYVKKSTRTALMISVNRTFYIGQLDNCTV